MIVRVARRVDDVRGDVEATQQLAEQRVTEIEESLRAECHKELRAVGIATGVGQRQLPAAAEHRARMKPVIVTEDRSALAVGVRLPALED